MYLKSDFLTLIKITRESGNMYIQFTNKFLQQKAKQLHN